MNCNSFSIDYGILADFSGGGFDDLPTLRSLIPGVSATGSIPPGPLLNSRQFLENVPNSATALTVMVQGSTNVDLFVRHERVVTLGVEGLPAADAIAETNSSTERLTIDSLTFPSLIPGTYAIGISSADGNSNAQFSVTAIISTDDPQSVTFQPIQADPSVALTVPVANGTLPVLSATQYTIEVPNGATKLTLTGTTNVQNSVVLIRRGSPVEVDGAILVFDHFLYAFPEGRTEISPSSFLFPPLEPGAYYIAILSASSSSLTV